MSELYLSRISLRRDNALAALVPILVPEESGAQTGAAHRLIWAAFADTPDRKRDFLWRQDDKGRWLVLSRRIPEDPHRIFDIETKTFEPSLKSEDRLIFALRANAAVTRKNAEGKRKRSDIVMDRLHALEKNARALARSHLTSEASAEWLAGQGERAGFKLDRITAAYHTEKIPRGQLKPIELGILDMEGVIAVDKPDLFLSSLALGFGKAKGFGCGLMLIRRER